MKIQLPFIHTTRPARSILGEIRRLFLRSRATLIICALPFLGHFSPAQGQGLETFDNSNATSSYLNGSFTGQGGIEWTYVHARDEGTYPIDGKGLMLRRASEPSSLSATITGGIGNFSVDTRKAFTGNPQRQIELLINGVVHAQFEPTFGDGADDTVIPFVVEDINVAGTVTLEIRVFDATNSTTNRQITLDNLAWTGFSAGSVAPAVGAPTISNLEDTEVTLSSVFFANDGADFTEYGFVIAQNAVNSEPSLGDLDVDVIDFAGTPSNPIEAILSGLTPATEYAVRSYVIYDNGAETVYSPSVITFTTPLPNPLLTATPYTEDFSSFVDMASLPAGWSFDLQGSSGAYIGDWGTGFSSGFRGNGSVLGYQISNTSDSLIKILTLVNDTGETITDLTIQYVGRGSRLDQLKGAEYKVSVADVEISALAYSTFDGDGQLRQAVVSGLNIPDGESFTIEWAASQIAAPAGSTHQIGISNINITTGSVLLPPTIGFFGLFESSITETGFGVDAEVTSDGGSTITQMGFILTETEVEPVPDLDTPSALIVLDDFPGIGEFWFDFEDLNPSTSYTVRAFATNSEGTTYTAPLVVTTLSPPPSVQSGEAYTESFSNFTGTLPAGWSVSGPVTAYAGDWGVTGAGMRGGEETPGVLGFQHTSATGTFTVTLELVNDTGETINNLLIAYTGRVELATEGRTPAWTVSVDGVEVPELSYSTASGVDEDIEFLLTGLNIPNGESFTISWSSDRGDGSGSSRQIGLSNVSVESIVVDIPIPVLSLAPGTFFADQTVFVSNFEEFDTDVDLFYTLDGSTPDALSSLYDNTTGILLEDGNGAITLRVIAIDSTTDAKSFITSATYTFPVNVADLETLRGQATGSTIYRVTGEITFTGGDTFRNTKFFQDASGFGIQIDDPGPTAGEQGVVTTTYSVGDNVQSLLGTLGAFQGQLQLIPSFDPGAAVSTGNEITPVVRTLATLTNDDQSTLVRINAVEFENAGDNFGGGGSEIGITDESIVGFTGIYRNFFGASDISGSEIPAGEVDIIAVVQSRTAGLTIGARSLADIIVDDTPPGQGSAFDSFMEMFQGLQLSDRAPDAAPAGDGVANAAKFVFGGSPLIPDRSMLPASNTVEDNGDTFFVLRLNFARAATWDSQTATFIGDGFTVQVRSSGDLVNFDPAVMDPLSGINQVGEVEADSVVELRSADPISGAQFFDTVIDVGVLR